MDVLTEFVKEYENLKILYPELYVSINDIGNKGLWRISIFGKEMGIIGDAVFMTVESTNKETAFRKAIKQMQVIPTQIVEAIKIKQSGRKIVVKRD